LNVLLVATYELGRQPFGLAHPAALLRGLGVVVRTLDLAVECVDESAFRSADLIAFYLPMHTATRPGGSTGAEGQSLESGRPACGLWALRADKRELSAPPWCDDNSGR